MLSPLSQSLSPLWTPPKVAAVGSAYAATVLADSPIAYWRLGESSGFVAHDASGNGHDGIYSGSPLPTLGVAGAIVGDPDTAVQFNQSGGAAGYVDGGSSNALRPTGGITYECWAKAFNTSIGIMMINRTGEFETSGVTIFVLSGNWQFWGCSSDGSWAVQLSSAATTNSWTHLALTWDGSLLTGYVNGSAVGNQNISALFWHTDGGQRIGGDDSGNDFDGVLDEVAVYDHALSSTRVAAHYAAGI